MQTDRLATEEVRREWRVKSRWMITGLGLQKRSDPAKKSKEGWASGDKGNLWIQGKKHRDGSGCNNQNQVQIATKAGGWRMTFTSSSCRGPVADLSGEIMFWFFFCFFGQNAAISYLLIIPKCRECQEPVTAAIFTVLMHSQCWPTDGTPERLVKQRRVKRMKRPTIRWLSACQSLC